MLSPVATVTIRRCVHPYEHRREVPNVSHPWPGWQVGDAGYRRLTFALFAAGFATFAQIFGAQAALPAASREFDVSASTAAFSVSAAALGVAMSVLPWARVSDRIGRTRAMTYSIVSATIIGLLVAVAPTFEAVIAVRFVAGLAIGAVPAIAVAYLVEEVVPSRVAIAASVYVAGNTVGGVSGRILAGPMSETFGWRWAMFGLGVAGFLAAVAFITVVPRPRGFRPHSGGEKTFRHLLFHLTDPATLAVYAQGFLLMGAFAAIYNYLGYRVVDPPYGVPASLVGLLFITYLFGTLASRLSGSLVGRYGPLPVIVGGIATMLVGLGLLLIPSLIVVIVGLVVFTVGTFTAHPTASGQSGVLPQVGRAQSTALFQLSWLTGTAAIGWAAGLAFVSRGWPLTVGVAGALCVVAAVIAGLGLGVLPRPDPPGDGQTGLD